MRWGISSAGRATALQAVGQGFDPPMLHQIETGAGSLWRTRTFCLQPIIRSVLPYCELPQQAMALQYHGITLSR